MNSIDGMTYNMLPFMQGGSIMGVEKLSISLSREMVQILDELAEKMKLTRSGVVQKLLEKHRQEELEKLMIEGYLAMAEENLREAEESIWAQSEVILRGM